MRILYFVHQFLPDNIGGTEIYTLGLAKRAQDLGNWVAVLYYYESQFGKIENFGFEEGEYEGITTFKLHYNLSSSKNPAKYEYDNSFVYQKIQEKLKDLEPDLVHCTHAMKLSCSALQACIDFKIPFFLTMPDYWFICLRHTLLKWNQELCNGPENKYACTKCLHDTHQLLSDDILELPEKEIAKKLQSKRINPFVSNRNKLKQAANALCERNNKLKTIALAAKKIFVLSEFQQRLLAKNGFPIGKLYLIPHGIESTTIKLNKSNKDRNKIKLTFIGSIVPAKGLDFLLNVLEKCQNKLIELNIYGNYHGSSSYLNSIRKKVAQLGFVNLKGTFLPQEIDLVYEETDVLVLPAQWFENEPIVVKTALHFKIPVLASKIGSLVEMIEQGESGWLLPHDEEAAWIYFFNQLTENQLNLSHRSQYKVYSMQEHFELIYQEYNKV